MEAQEDMRGVELNFEKTSYFSLVLWSLIKSVEMNLKSLMEQAGGSFHRAPIWAASLSGAAPSSRRSEQWKIYTLAANEQMVSSLMEDHLKTPRHNCILELLFLRRISFKGNTITRHFFLRWPLC